MGQDVSTYEVEAELQRAKGGYSDDQEEIERHILAKAA